MDFTYSFSIQKYTRGSRLGLYKNWMLKPVRVFDQTALNSDYGVLREIKAETHVGGKNSNQVKFNAISGTIDTSGTLFAENKKPLTYSPVFLYKTDTGTLLDRVCTDVNGFYKFINLKNHTSYFIVAYDPNKKMNATIVEFTVKEETNE